MTTGLKLEAIVLAAGLGRRFGGGKLTAELPGGRLIDRSLACALAAPARSVWVVVGADPAVAKAAYAGGAKVVEAEDYAAGLSASLRAGIEALPGDCDGAFIFLGDMPRVPQSILRLMAEALDDGAFAVAPVFHGRRGHPVLFSNALFAELLTLEGDKGAGALLDGLGEGLVTIPAPDDGVLFDVDERIFMFYFAAATGVRLASIPRILATSRSETAGAALPQLLRT
ncbi:MAG: nucleotidyltransferase family protein [Alphaproteobacteria bacterium]